jgi:transposase InsO family protein
MRMHLLLGHAGMAACAQSFGVRFPADLVCETCLVTKSKCVPHPGHESEARVAGQFTHCDTWGPFSEAFYYRGCRYAIAFVDGYSRFKVVVFTRDRTASTLLAAYRQYVAVMRSYGVSVFGTLQSDQGPEYVSEEAFDFCDEHAINRLLSVRYTAPQNGTAEAVFGVYVPRTRAILRAAGMEKRFWALAFSHAVWVGNRTHSSAIDGCPISRLPHPPAGNLLRHAREFGCTVYAHQPKIDRPHKMSDTARKGVVCGCDEMYKGWVVYYPETRTSSRWRTTFASCPGSTRCWRRWHPSPTLCPRLALCLYRRWD